jgi:hypothetical protein
MKAGYERENDADNLFSKTRFIMKPQGPATETSKMQMGVRSPTGNHADSEKEIQDRQTRLMKWMGVGGIAVLMSASAFFNGGIGVFDALWQILMGGTAGVVCRRQCQAVTKKMPVLSSVGSEGESNTSKSSGGFLPAKVWSLLWGRWPPGRTAAMFLAGACITAVATEAITPVGDLGNSALLTIPSVLIGVMMGGIGFALDESPRPRKMESRDRQNASLDSRFSPSSPILRDR